MVSYKAVMRPALDNASSIWSPLAFSTSINKLQVIQNAPLRTSTGCTHETNIQHLHDETLTLPIHEDLQLHASQHKQKTQHPSHPLYKRTPYFNTSRLKKSHYLQQRPPHNKYFHRPHTVTTTDIKTACNIYTHVLSLAARGNNKILHTP